MKVFVHLLIHSFTKNFTIDNSDNEDNNNHNRIVFSSNLNALKKQYLQRRLVRKEKSVCLQLQS